MADRELLELAAKAAAYVGQKRLWTPNYPGARPVECTAWNCSITASFTHKGTTATVGSVWTNYRSLNGRLEQVWFPAEQWEAMPSVKPEHVCGMQGYNGMIDPPCPGCEARRNAGVQASDARHQRTGLPLKGCPASNAIKGNHERDAYGRCALCGDGPQPTKRGDSEYTMGDWWRDLENPHGNR